MMLCLVMLCLVLAGVLIGLPVRAERSADRSGAVTIGASGDLVMHARVLQDRKSVV